MTGDRAKRALAGKTFRCGHRQCRQGRARIKELGETIRDLLLSADCTWEERKEGHDWAEACVAARRALAGEVSGG